MSEWISVKERLPEIDMESAVYERCVNVIAATRMGRVIYVSYISNGYAKTQKGREPRFEWMGKICPFDITHWMPLPEPPACKQ